MSADVGLFDVRGRTALVTGGSSGIGRMIAEGLVRAGAKVAVSSRDPERCDAAVRELSEFGDCAAIPTDLATFQGAVDLAAALPELFGDRLDILVHSAGATWGAPLEEFPESGWDRAFDVNAKGPFFLTRELLPLLRAGAAASPPARVIVITSGAASRVHASESYSYAASKAAAEMLTRQLAWRLARDSITVNAIAPGHFESRMTRFMFADEERLAGIVEAVPLGRVGSWEDMVGATLFLAGRAGAYLTGAVLPVDGGFMTCRP